MEMQLAADREDDKRRREEKERDRRTQLAIDEAIQKEPSRTEQIGSDQRQGETVRADHPVIMVAPPSYEITAGGKVGATVRYCSECGNSCKVRDRFCSNCGCKQATDDWEQTLGEDLRGRV